MRRDRLPHFPWHVTNLDNYINVRPGTVAQRTTGDITLTSFSSGTAAIGLPGDFSPPSRFVRAALFRATTPPLARADDAVSHAFHILHSFDIPIGVKFDEDERDQIPTSRARHSGPQPRICRTGASSTRRCATAPSSWST